MRAALLLCLAAAWAAAPAAHPDAASILRDLTATQDRQEVLLERMRAAAAEAAGADKELLSAPDPEAVMARREAAARRMHDSVAEFSDLVGHSRRLIEDLQVALFAGSVSRRGAGPPSPALARAAEQLSEIDARRDRLDRVNRDIGVDYARELEDVAPVLKAYRARVRTRRLLRQAALGALALAALGTAIWWASGSSRTAGPA